MKIENLHRDTLNFVVDGKPNKDGVPPTESLEPKESRDIDIPDTDSARAQIAAYVASGLIKVSGAGAKAAIEAGVTGAPPVLKK